MVKLVEFMKTSRISKEFVGKCLPHLLRSTSKEFVRAGEADISVHIIIEGSYEGRDSIERSISFTNDWYAIRK